MKHILDSQCLQNRTYEILKASVSGESGILTLEIRLNFIVPIHLVDEMEQSALREIPGLRGVRINFKYEDVDLEREEIVQAFLGHMIRMVNGRYAVITKTILPEELSLEGDLLHIYALGDTAVRKLNEEVADQFEGLLLEHFGLRLRVRFHKLEVLTDRDILPHLHQA